MSDDPMGLIIAELRDANIAGGRVRGYEPANGDARPAGSFQRFVVIVDLGGPPVREVIQRLRYVLRCYGATPQDARALWGDVRAVLHLAGVRSSGDVRVYQTRDDTGGSAHHDPETKQPYYDGVYDVTAGFNPAV